MTILVIGAGSGIGKFLAKKLSNIGHTVFGTYNLTRPNESDTYGLQKVNATNEVQVQEWIEALNLQDVPHIGLVNCVGISYNAMTHKSDTAKWMNVVDTNVKSSYLITKHVLPIMRAKKFGRIIHLSSVVPLYGVAGTSSYAATKSALWGFAKSVAIENAMYGITINTLNLGYFDIGMIREIPQDVLSSIISRIPTGKLGNPENIYNAIIFLLESDYITGSQVNLNGGLY